MSDSTLLLVIATGTIVILAVSITGFVIFSKFLKKEEIEAKRFRDIHGTPPPDER